MILCVLGNLAETLMIWPWLYEPRTTCSHEPLPTNHSGVTVLAAGMGKTGTSSMCDAFYKVGLTNTYHGIDVGFRFVTPVVDEYWSRVENGGNGDPRSIATVFGPARMGNVFWQTNSSREALRESGTATLASWLSRCRVDGMSFDGVEDLFRPVYDASPGVKVVILSWRTFKEWEKSMKTYGDYFFTHLIIQAYFYSSIHLLPWGALIMPALNLIRGGELDEFLRSGASVTYSRGLAVRYYHNQMFPRHVFAHAMSGIIPEMYYYTEEQYYEYFERVRGYVPQKDRMEWNMKKHTLKDLCEFLGIKDHPGCKEPMPRVTVELLRFERNEPGAFLVLIAIFFTCHILNYKIIYGTLGVIFGLVPWRRKAKGE